MSPLEERKFLHEVASPVSTALFTIDLLIGDLNAESQEVSKEGVLAKAQLVYKALEKVRNLLKERRALLISLGEEK